MPINIEGWVEFSPYRKKEEQNDQHSWISWMDIRSLIHFNDEINWILMGNPKDFKSDNPRFKPIAKNRGLPKNPSHYLQIDIERISEHETKYGEGEIFGFTYLSYSEIEKINWQIDYQIQIDKSDWGKLFELINTFRDLKNIKSQQIRLVLWYNC